jgi:hypothetical protein
MSSITLAPDASGTAIFTVAAPNSSTNRTLTLPDETGTLTTTAAVTAAIAAAVAAVQSMTLLGTLTTTSGTTQSLTSLTLTGYKQLVLEFNGVSHSSGSNSNLTFGAGQLATGLTSSNVVTGMVWVSLVTGIAVSIFSTNALPNSNNSGQNAQTGYSTATTTVTLTVSNPSFDAGSVLVYGVK